VKVIFLQDMPKVDRAGEIKEVADGYGRNFLIPRKLAVLVKPENINTIKAQLEAKARSQAQTEAGMLELANQLNGKEIVIEARKGAKDKLYGSITTADIADGIKNTTGLEIDKRKIELAESIRQIGSYDITLKLAKDVATQIKVTVTEKSAETAAS